MAADLAYLPAGVYFATETCYHNRQPPMGPTLYRIEAPDCGRQRTAWCAEMHRPCSMGNSFGPSAGTGGILDQYRGDNNRHEALL